MLPFNSFDLVCVKLLHNEYSFSWRECPFNECLNECLMNKCLCDHISLVHAVTLYQSQLLKAAEESNADPGGSSNSWLYGQAQNGASLPCSAEPREMRLTALLQNMSKLYLVTNYRKSLGAVVIGEFTKKSGAAESAKIFMLASGYSFHVRTMLDL